MIHFGYIVRARARERYNLAQVARILGVSRCTVTRWARAGKLRAANPFPGVWRVRKAAIRRFLDENPDVAIKCASKLWWPKPKGNDE